MESIYPQKTVFPTAIDYRGSALLFHVNFVTTFLKASTMRDTVRADALARALPFLLFIAVLALRGALPASEPGNGAGDLRWLYGVQAAAACGALLLLRSRYRELARPRFAAGQFLLSLLGGGAVFLLWIAP